MELPCRILETGEIGVAYISESCDVLESFLICPLFGAYIGRHWAYTKKSL